MHGRSASIDGMKGAYLGPRYDNEEIRARLDSVGAKYQYLDENQLIDRLAGILADENVVGWLQGRMEFGPRALGGRSIIGDPRSIRMQSVMNLKIKYRESFRPFAPSVLYERVSITRAPGPSPPMLITAPVREHPHRHDRGRTEAVRHRQAQRAAPRCQPFPRRLFGPRPDRARETNPRYHALLRAFEKKTGCPVW
jgi:carbamoyltransferase